MILFRTIKYKNLLSSGNAFTEIFLDRNHSTLIVGENGAGKSSILDALCFVLYGKPFRKINKGMLVNSINGKNLVVEIEFQIGKKEYRIKRGIKPNIFEIYQDGEIVNQNAESKEYQDYLEKNILKLNFKSFSQIVVLGSASFVPFMQLSAQHRREVIEDLLDIQIFSTMNTLLKEKVQTNKNDLQKVDYAAKSNAEKIEIIKRHLQSLKANNNEQILQKQQQIEEFSKEMIEHENVSQKTKKAIEELENLIGDEESLSKKLSKITTLQSQLEAKYNKLEKELSFFHDNDTCPTCLQGIDHEHKDHITSTNSSQQELLKDAREKLQKEYSNIDVKLKEIFSTNKQITELNKNVSNLNVKIQSLNNFIATIQKEISNLRNDKKSSEDNSEELRDARRDLKAAIEQKEELQKEKQVLDVAALLLRDSGIKTRIIKQYVPIMNKLINKYLASMDFFVNFELDENFQEKIKSRHRDEFTYESFSEGEKMRIDLSLLFTWRAIAKLRNSISTNLLIMDEVFDSSLDGSGTEEFLKIIQNLTKDTNIFIISHKGDQLYDKFQHIIKFEKHKNFSRIAS
jgi:DNA repair exonuclease SbcCD ATPase subunit